MDWFRMYGEFATDPKVQMMSEAMQRRLVMLFCLECSNGIETFHVTDRETSIAFALRVSESDLAETKALFLRKNFINEDWTLCNWSSRQYQSDSSTARVKAHREKKKAETKQGETLQKRSRNALEQNRTDTEQITSSSLRDSTDTRSKFSMNPDWLPGAKSFPAVLTMNAMAGQTFQADQLLEFKSFWIASPDEHRTQAKWEHALAQFLKRDLRHQQATGRPNDERLNNTGSRPDRQGPRSAVDRVKQHIADRHEREAVARTHGQALDQDDRDVRTPLDGEFRRES